MLITKSYRNEIKKMISPKIGYRSSDNKNILIKNLFKFILIVLIFSALITIFEGIEFWDAVWFSLTTNTTVGYGDWSPKTILGKITTVIFDFFLAITIMLAFIESCIAYNNHIRILKINGLWGLKAA